MLSPCDDILNRPSNPPFVRQAEHPPRPKPRRPIIVCGHTAAGGDEGRDPEGPTTPPCVEWSFRRPRQRHGDTRERREGEGEREICGGKKGKGADGWGARPSVCSSRVPYDHRFSPVPDPYRLAPSPPRRGGVAASHSFVLRTGSTDGGERGGRRRPSSPPRHPVPRPGSVDPENKPMVL